MKEKTSMIIGICGGSGSGKTSFVKALRQSYSIEEVCIMSMDDYYHPRENQEVDNDGVSNFDLPTSLDDTTFLENLKSLLAGNVVTRNEYTFNNEKATSQKLHFSPAPIIIVEGLFVFHYEEVAKLMDYKIFIGANEDLKIIRRIRRDSSERNYPLEDVLYRYEKHVQPAYKKYIEPYKDMADIIINNQFNYEKGLEFVKAFISSKLR